MSIWSVMSLSGIVNRLLLVSLVVICFNEVIIYYINSFSWQQINNASENSTRIMLIADPQLLGNTFSKEFYSGLARYDCDRYLRKTFQHALRFIKPHVICFLGDLLDEGSQASDDDFQTYVQRFNSIYQINDEMAQVHIPGDNDIGGEDGEIVTSANVQRFREAFELNDISDYRGNNLRFFKINRMLMDFSNPYKANNTAHLRIGLSHMPILISGGYLLRSIIKEIDPHVIFSGHWHESRIFLHPSTTVRNFYESEVIYYNLTALKDAHTYLEIMVPTASYRMGKFHMGIGYATIERQNLYYTVLWLPNRFAFLTIYAFWLLLALIIIISTRMKMRNLCYARRKQTVYTSILNEEIHYFH